MSTLTPNINSLASMKRAFKTPGIQIEVVSHWQPQLVGTIRVPKEVRAGGKPGIQANGYWFDAPRFSDGKIVEMWADIPKASELSFNDDGTVTFYPATEKSWTLRFGTAVAA